MRPESGSATGVEIYNRSQEVRPELRYMTGVISFDRSRDIPTL
jgi:hypothetical protein